MASRRLPARDLPTILLVEDDHDLSAALRFALELDGFEVRCFITAEEFLKAERPAKNALLILDEKLPGMAGLEMLEALRERGEDLPVILITTPTRQVVARALEMGVPLIEKPLITDDLARRVREMAADKA